MQRCRGTEVQRYRGFGLSDSDVYAARLRRALRYRNTFYHRCPRLDICAPPSRLSGKLDFIIASDVLEHVPPPVAVAFANLAGLLKRGGSLVMSVPYGLGESTAEHFPELFDYRVEPVDGSHVLVNKTRDGRRQEFRDLVFHGGPGSTLEMRVFCRSDVLQHLEQAGFVDIHEHNEEMLAFGIAHENPCSLVMSARKG